MSGVESEWQERRRNGEDMRTRKEEKWFKRGTDDEENSWGFQEGKEGV